MQEPRYDLLTDADRCIARKEAIFFALAFAVAVAQTAFLAHHLLPEPVPIQHLPWVYEFQHPDREDRHYDKRQLIYHHSYLSSSWASLALYLVACLRLMRSNTHSIFSYTSKNAYGETTHWYTEGPNPNSRSDINNMTAAQIVFAPLRITGLVLIFGVAFVMFLASLASTTYGGFSGVVYYLFMHRELLLYAMIPIAIPIAAVGVIWYLTKSAFVALKK